MARHKQIHIGQDKLGRRDLIRLLVQSTEVGGMVWKRTGTNAYQAESNGEYVLLRRATTWEISIYDTEAKRWQELHWFGGRPLKQAVERQLRSKGAGTLTPLQQRAINLVAPKQLNG